MGVKNIPEAKVVEGNYSTIRSGGDKAPLRKMFSAISGGISKMFRNWSWNDFWWGLFGLGALAICGGLIVFGFQACERRDNQMQEMRLIYVNKCKTTPKEAKKLYPNLGDQGGDE